MADLPSWTDPSTWIGGGGALAGVYAVVKVVLDWRKDKGKDRSSSEELLRDDLMEEMKELRSENKLMRAELTEARQESRVTSEQWERRFREYGVEAERRLRECEERAVRFQRRLVQIEDRLTDDRPLPDGGNAS